MNEIACTCLKTCTADGSTFTRLPCPVHDRTADAEDERRWLADADAYLRELFGDARNADAEIERLNAKLRVDMEHMRAAAVREGEQRAEIERLRAEVARLQAEEASSDIRIDVLRAEVTQLRKDLQWQERDRGALVKQARRFEDTLYNMEEIVRPLVDAIEVHRKGEVAPVYPLAERMRAFLDALTAYRAVR